MKESKEVTCLICNKKMKNIKGIGMHVKLHKITYENYCNKFSILYIKPNKNYKKDYKCKICNKEINFRGIGRHVKLHNLTYQKYYDLYHKIKNEDICYHPDCNNITKFIGFSGYKKYCSRKCGSSDPIIVKNRTEVYKKTLEENPNIKKQRINSYKKTLEENPEIVKKRVKKYKLWCEENPEEINKKTIKGSLTKIKNDTLTNSKCYSKESIIVFEKIINNIDFNHNYELFYAENEWMEFINKNNIKAASYDFVIRNKKSKNIILVIEYHGSAWHITKEKYKQLVKENRDEYDPFKNSLRKSYGKDQTKKQHMIDKYNCEYLEIFDYEWKENKQEILKKMKFSFN